ncbi:cell division topological specificity factor [Achromatium sp. WMS2]|nr:cell division topological specificity factor [Achromatium sp. WMS2]
MASLLERFRMSYSTPPQKGSALVAKERLQILVAHDRAERNRPPYLPKLQKDILDVVRKYVNVDLDSIQVTYEQNDQQEILELNIILPESSHHRNPVR